MIGLVMKQETDLAVRKCVETALAEWKETYPEYVELRDRLKTLANSIPPLAKSRELPIDPDRESEMAEFLAAHRPSMPRARRTK